jgi:hypothetical protein
MGFIKDNITFIAINLSLAFILTGILWYLKKADLLIIRIILGLMGSLLLFGGIGFVTAQTSVSLPFMFWQLVFVGLLIGGLLAWRGHLAFPWSDDNTFTSPIITTAIWTVAGMLGFSMVFGMLSTHVADDALYGSVGIVSLFLPVVLKIAYTYWCSIPELRYRRWYYNPASFLPVIEPIDVVRVNIQFTKAPNESPPIFEGYWVDLPSGMELGTLFHYFIYSHNNRHRDYKRNPIPYTHEGQPIGWVLYKKTNTDKTVYLNTETSLKQNTVGENDTIFAEGFTD